MGMNSFLHLSSIATILLMTSCSLNPGVPHPEEKQKSIDAYTGETAEAIFAGGCFWCIESVYEEHFDGVIAAISGFAGGEEENPTYDLVSSGSTGHREAVRIVYDPQKVSYRELVEFFWKQIDPTDDEGSFVDRGFQYTSAIFYGSEEEKAIAEESKKQMDASGRYDAPIVTPILPKTTFYPAEDYHQDYYHKNPIRYKYYRNGSGRDQYLESVWGEK